jgi:adenylate cyclase
MRPATQKRLGALLIWIVVSVVAALSIQLDLLRDFELRTWDWRLRAIAGQYPHNPKIKIITIDQASLDHFASKEKIFWPWPRSLYVPVLEFLKRSGARAVAFDMLFTEGSGRVEEDVEFAGAVQRTLPVASALVLRGEAPVDGPLNEELLAEIQSSRRDSIERYLSPFSVRSYPFALLPTPELAHASRALGNVTAEPDSDRIFRSTVPGARLQEIPILNLPFALFNVTEPDSSKIADLGGRADARGKLLVRFFGPAGTYENFSMHAVINSFLELEEGKQPAISLETFKDSYVFIGGTAPGLLDLRPVPVGGAYSGVEINATILDNLLQGRFLRQLDTMSAIGVTIALLALVCCLTIVWSQHQGIVAIASLLGWGAVCVAGAFAGWWIPLVAPIGACAVAVSAGFFLQYQLEGKQHRFIRGAFQHYVTAEVVNKLTADPSLLSLGGDRKELTMFFSDIAGFTTLSENMSPAELVRFINKFLSEMTDIILSVEGTIDKYEGDAIIAFWNAPIAVGDHATRAVRAALQCQRRLRELQGYFTSEFKVDVAMRVGINTGIVTVGNFGSAKRFNYTMIGDAANLASRLEGTNKVFGTRILVSEATKQQVRGDFSWRRVADVQVKGKKQVTRLYEPLDGAYQSHIIAQLAVFEAAMEAFDAGDHDEAERLFQQMSGDLVSDAYLRRIKEQRERGEEMSPVWILLEK